MPTWLTNIHNQFMPYYGFVGFIAAIFAIAVSFLTIFSISKKYHFPGKFFKICFDFFKRIWQNLKSTPNTIKNIFLTKEELLNLTQRVSKIEDSLKNNFKDYSTHELPDKFFIDHGFIWEYTDKTKQCIKLYPLCLYCYDKEKRFFHMFDVTQEWERQDRRDFLCKNCKEMVRIHIAAYQNILREEIF